MKTRELTKAEYGAFYQGYIEVLGDADLLEELRVRKQSFQTLLNALNDDLLRYSYAPGKWSIGELILHIIDSERVFQYRALRIGRGDITELHGFDQDLFVLGSESNRRSLEGLIREFSAVREASQTLFESFSKEALLRTAKASGSEVSVRALGFMISGHQKHHELLLQQRYLQQ